MGEFRFFRPQGLTDLLEYKSREGKRARILDGGSNVLVYVKEGAVEGGTLVDVRSLQALKGIEVREGRVEIGAGEVVADVVASPLIRRQVPFLAEALKSFANPLVRNMATLAGNIADSSPIGDSIPPLLVLQAEVVVASASGERTIALQEFFTGPGANVLRPEEVIRTVRFPVPAAGRGVYRKLGLRKGTSCAVASVAVWLVEEGGRVGELRIAFGGVAPTPRRAPATEAGFRGQKLERGAIDRLAEAAAAEVSPISDVRASAEYRRRVSVRLLAQAVRAAAGLED